MTEERISLLLCFLCNPLVTEAITFCIFVSYLFRFLWSKPGTYWVSISGWCLCSICLLHRKVNSRKINVHQKRYKGSFVWTLCMYANLRGCKILKMWVLKICFLGTKNIFVYCLKEHMPLKVTVAIRNLWPTKDLPWRKIKLFPRKRN